MATVIVVTNFSESSRNALDYTCLFLNNPATRVLLLNIYSFPASITNEGLAIAAMSETMANDEKRLEREYEWVRENYPQINIDTDLRAGNFFDELRNRAGEEDTALIVMGAAGNFTDLLAWDVNIIDSFIDLPIPVLIVPMQVPYRPVKKISFACNYFRRDLEVPVRMIRKLVQHTNAQLSIIHVNAPDVKVTEAGMRNREMLQANLADLSPVYHDLEYDNVITAIDNYIKEEDIDLLLVIPTRLGLWKSFFQKGNTKGLIYLNQVPVMSLRAGAEFI